jgi:uncharacterized damage-inducible protein DinB
MTPEHARFLAEELVSLWEGEFPATCAVLAAVPDAAHSYKPDEKSRTAWDLTRHIATSDPWFLDGVIQGKFEWDQKAIEAEEQRLRTVAEVVEHYRRAMADRFARIKAMPGEKLAATNDFFGMFQWPNARFVGFATNHSVHHRGQLASYLRAMGSKVPAIYGASADTPMQG